jgi:hypothetical protein
MNENNKSGQIHNDSFDCREHTHGSSHEHDEHCGCSEHEHEGSAVREKLYADSNEIPGIYSDGIEIFFKKEIKWDAFTNSLVNWIEEARYWLSINGSMVGHIKIFAAGTNGQTLWLATTGKSLNAEYSPELHSCGNDSIDSCRLSMTFIVLLIGGDRLKEEVLKLLEKNISIYRA